MRYKYIGYNINIMRQSACLVINPVMVDIFASLFLLHAGWSCIRPSDEPNIKLVDLLVGTGLSLVCCLIILGSTGVFLLLLYFSGIAAHPGVPQMSQYVSVESSPLTHHRPCS